MDITTVFRVADGGETLYIGVARKGIVKGAHAFLSEAATEDSTIILSRDGTAVNTITIADNQIAADRITGVPDTNKNLVFDPESTTAGDNAIKVVVADTFDSVAHISLVIEYDDFKSVDTHKTGVITETAT